MKHLKHINELYEAFGTGFSEISTQEFGRLYHKDREETLSSKNASKIWDYLVSNWKPKYKDCKWEFRISPTYDKREIYYYSKEPKVEMKDISRIIINWGYNSVEDEFDNSVSIWCLDDEWFLSSTFHYDENQSPDVEERRWEIDQIDGLINFLEHIKDDTLNREV